MSDLGKLERIANIRAIWPHEAHDFTRWLAQDAIIADLSRTIGFGADGLEVVGTEQSVGGFKADIVCRETTPTGRVVVIENQFDATDHDHVGKLLTYAAGQDAKVLILIAEEIREEHEAALDLLNAMSSDDFQVFGIEIEVWRIGDSPAAPRFNVVSKPNDWKRHEKRRATVARDVSDLRPAQVLQMAFWQALRDRLEPVDPPFNPVSPLPQNWISHGIGKAGVGLNMSMNTRENWVRVEIYLGGETAKSYFATLQAHRAAIEGALGETLDWQLLPEKQDCRICLTRPAPGVSDQTTWSDLHDWMVRNAIAMHGAFHPHVRNLDRDMAKVL